MADQHRYPSTEENTRLDPVGGAAPRRRRKTLLWAAIAVGLIALFVVLHLTGVVGAESH